MDMSSLLFESFNSEENSSDPVIEMLVKALASELLAASKYWYCMQASKGKGKSDADPEFKLHYDEEMLHATTLAKRINELGGNIPSGPSEWMQKWEFTPVEGANVRNMLESNIADEKGAIEFYGSIVDMTVNSDSTTYDVAKLHKAKEEEHLHDLELLLQELDDN